MRKYVLRPETVDAIRFQQGLDGAMDVIAWLLDKGITASYFPAIPHPTQPETLILKECVRISIPENSTWFIDVPPGDWIVIEDPRYKERIKSFRHGEFLDLYQEADDEP